MLRKSYIGYIYILAILNSSFDTIKHKIRRIDILRIL